MVSRVVTLSLRVFEFFMTLLIMSLIGNVIALAIGNNASLINYSMFVAVFSMLSLFYLIAVAWNDGLAGHPVVPLVLDVLNVIFTLVGGIALAAELGVHSCHNAAYTSTNKLTRHSTDNSGRCRELQATTAFMWFSFAAFVVSMVFSIFGSKGGVNMRSGGIRKGGPVMSQV